MRENRPSGSEGGVAFGPSLPLSGPFVQALSDHCFLASGAVRGHSPAPMKLFATQRCSSLACSMLLLAWGATTAQPAPAPGDWPQWRGPNRDGLSAETGFLQQWPEGGPKLAWSNRQVGVGYAGPALVGDRIYLLGDLADGCYLQALERATGKLLWKTRLADAGGNRSYPGPRATPTIDGDRLITMTQYGDVVCLDLPDGRLRWRKNLLTDLKGVQPMWHFGEAPLVDGDKVLCTPGGPDGTLAALDKQTGQVLWRSVGLTNVPTYVSIVPAEIAGVRQYLQMTVANVFGVDARTGLPLWVAERVGERAIVPTPVYADGQVYVTSGYGVGCHLFAIEKNGPDFAARQVYAARAIASHHGGVVKWGDHVYGHSDAGGWTCQEFKTGKIVWQAKGVGKGSVTYADGRLYCRSEDGPVALVEATPAGYSEKGRFVQPDRSSKKSWPHPVVAGGCLYLRDQDLLLCYDIKAR